MCLQVRDTAKDSLPPSLVKRVRSLNSCSCGKCTHPAKADQINHKSTLQYLTVKHLECGQEEKNLENRREGFCLLEVPEPLQIKLCDARQYLGAVQGADNKQFTVLISLSC